MPKNITIQKILSVLLQNLKFIIITTIIGGLLFFGYSKFIVVPMYSTYSMISIQNYNNKESVNAQNKKIYPADISGSTTLAKLCVTLFQNSDELTALYDGCGVSMYVNDDTFFITISVSGSDPQKCANVANAVAAKAQEVYQESFQYGQTKTIHAAKVPYAPYSPNNMQNTLIGLVAGLALSCVISILLELIDTRIKADDDIQEMYNIPVFAEIPDFEIQM